MTEASPIYFYSVQGEHGYLSNFARYSIHLDGQTWPTTEHFYQAHKFLDQEYRQLILEAASPSKAAKLGRAQPALVRADWVEVREAVMMRALLAKFTQYPELTERLLSTGTAPLVERTTLDSHWADGGDGSGLNRLGILLTQLREDLRRERR